MLLKTTNTWHMFLFIDNKLGLCVTQSKVGMYNRKNVGTRSLLQDDGTICITPQPREGVCMIVL